MEFQILRPFGPSIVKLKIPTNIIDDMNKYVDEVVKSDKKSKKLDFGPNLAGNVQQEIFLEIEFMKKIRWAEFLGNSCARWIAYEKNTKLTGFEIIRSWVVRQFKNDYNPIHYHSCQISGVGYIKVPNNMGETFQKDKTTNNNGKLVLIDGSKRFVCSPTYTITPEVGNFYFFPSYMMHTVYPFLDSSEERRSVSFNAKIDEDAARLR